MRKTTLAPALVLVLGSLAVTGCTDGNGPKDRRQPTQPSVVVEPVALEPELVRLEAVGTARARHSVELRPAVAGQVTAVNFDAGERVDAGEVLVQLDGREQRLAVELARVALADARRLLRRYEESVGSGAVTTSDLDAARSAVEAAQIELNRARVALDDRSIEAPFAGVVGLTDVDPGARITTDTVITTLDDRSVLRVRFAVPETLVERLAPGDPVTVRPWSSRSEPLTGRVIDIGSRIDPVSRTFPVKAELANPDDRLRPGMSFRVVLELEGPLYPVVPEVSVQWGGEGAYVWKIEQRRAARVPVTIVQRRQGRVLVEAALQPGDQVVREGIQRMREGVAVNVETEAATP